MELEKKTTILFPAKLHLHLTRVAKKKGVSLGHLVRLACEDRYGKNGLEDRLKAVAELRALALPVDTPRAMKKQSVPAAEDLLP